RAGIMRSDKDDRAVAEGDVDIAAVDVTPSARVPGDDPIGVTDDGDGHSSVLHLSSPQVHGRGSSKTASRLVARVPLQLLPALPRPFDLPEFAWYVNLYLLDCPGC